MEAGPLLASVTTFMQTRGDGNELPTFPDQQDPSRVATVLQEIAGLNEMWLDRFLQTSDCSAPRQTSNETNLPFSRSPEDQPIA